MNYLNIDNKMADYQKLIPFILKAEGGWVNDPSDSGGETNKGITYSTWKSIFGDTHDKFMKMSKEDWSVIYKKLYWDAAWGDKINSQRIANLIVDWVWGSGKHYPELSIQDILINSFNQHITKDGNFGQHTIDAINTIDEQKLYDLIIVKRTNYLYSITKSTPTNSKFLKGWLNRLNNLIEFNKYI